MGALAEDLGHTVVLEEDDQSTPAYATTLPGAGDVSDDGLVLETGAEVGRYVIVGRIGSGGMGVVYAGHDPKLDRRVAIKMLRPRNEEGRSRSSGRARLLREAQAMAKLSHPNVVAVYDVGLHADRVYVAMEFVDGRTLSEWLKEEPRTIGEVVTAFLAAGRGLAAAHAAEFVHRDFKPDNVLVDRNGRVLVMDFGLARATGPSNSMTCETRDMIDAPELDEPKLDDPMSTPLTHDGMVVGTPAYMSPEQHIGRAPDASSDQYAFCVALYEAVGGTRPFHGKGLRELALAKANRKLEPLAAGRSIPDALRTVLVRGLQPTPRARHPSMTVLLEAVERAVWRRRFPWLAAAGGVGVLGLCGVLIVAAVARSDEAQPCEEDKLAGIWDDGRKTAVREAIDSTEVSYAEETWVRVELWLDDYAGRWEHEYAAACGADTSGRDAETFDLRMRCLEQRRGELRATVAQLTAADSASVQRAVAQVSGIAAVEHCSDVVSLRSDVPPPVNPMTAAAVNRLRGELDEARALEQAGKFEDALAKSRGVAERAASLEYPPIRAEALLRVAAALGMSGKHAEAEAVLREASDLASGFGYDELTADAATRLVFEVGAVQQRFDEALEWSRHAEAALQRWDDASDKGALARARLQSNVAIVHGSLGRYEEEFEAMTAALEVKRRILGDEHPEVAGAIENVGLALANLGRVAEARERFAEALSMFRRLLGDRHPDVALSTANLAQSKTDMGDYAGAQILLEEARSIWVETRGEDSIEVGRATDSLGTTAGAQGRYEEALANHKRALEIFAAALGPASNEAAVATANMGLAHRAMRQHEQARAAFAAAAEITTAAYGRDHDFTAALLNDEAQALIELKRYDEAQGVLEEALAINKRVLAPTHPSMARSFNTLGRLYGMQGRWEEARQYHERALNVTMTAFGPDHPDTASTRLDLGYVALELGRPDEAIDHMTRVVATLGELDVEPAFAAEGRFGLAQALVAAGKDKDRALGLARQALQTFAGGGAYMKEDRERVQTWLEEHA